MKLPPDQTAIQAKCFHPSGTFVEFPIEEIEQSIPARFEKIVRLYPDRIAVRTKTIELTYAELNHAANRVAHAILAQRGLGQEPIGLLLPKGASLVVAMLGTLKAGKIHMPLAPTLPEARLSYMVEHSQAPLIVTSHEYLALANALSRSRCLNIDELETGRSVEDPCVSLSPDALAFIFYTSGSTGVPKGVIENHRDLLHHVRLETNDFHICAEDRITFLASQGRVVFRAVLNGAALYPVDIKLDGFTGLAPWLIQEEITIYHSVASAFRDFASALTGDERFPHLRLIKIMGETVYRRDVELYQKHFSENCIFVNLYGPNETGLLSHYLVDKALQIDSAIVPVGYAADDKEILIVDEGDKELGFEQPGEIVVRSRYLSPGYWRQPDLTRASFSPGSSDGTTRLYHTGDLGVMRPDGRLMHLGRKDFQVKIRGNRVEIAEVEMALMELDGVKEAVVVAREDVPGYKRLVAYIVPQSAPPPSVGTLRRALAARLPEYMIPSAVVLLDKLPVIGVGKVDRSALPVPDKGRPDLDVPYVAPGTPVEEELSRIWAEVLSLDEVGIHDNFFDLGGHSLSANRVVSRVFEQYRLEIPLQSLFRSPTIAEMAALISQFQGKMLNEMQLAAILEELASLSDAEAQRLVSEGNSTITKK